MKQRLLLRFLAHSCILLGAFAWSGGCSNSTNDCNDGADNDNDGLIDSLDPGCIASGIAESPDPKAVQCKDGIDNDNDGLIDTEDPGCENSEDQDEFNDPVAACQDGIDNDGDGLIDYPKDPGCELAISDNETDDCPDGPGCPACSNGVDDDGDGNADYPDDTGCTSAGDNSEVDLDPTICGNAVLIQPLPDNGQVMGTINGEKSSELASEECGGTGEEHVYEYETDKPVALTMTTKFDETTLDTVIYLRSECKDSDTELGCNDDDGLLVSTLYLDRVEPGKYYIVVDAVNAAATGDYLLKVTATTPHGEVCNAEEPNCAPGLVCRLATPDAANTTCVKPECSDGIDNDDDSLGDYPNDPGCEDPTDNDESDNCPDGEGCPACGNGIDDDNDGLTDFAGGDPGCLSAADTNEANECVPGKVIFPLDGNGASGTTSGNSYFDPTCENATGSPEDVYHFRLERDLVSLDFSTIGSSFDTVLSVRFGSCESAAAQIGCADKSSEGENLTITSPEKGNYFVIVDGAGKKGDYVLNLLGTIPAGGACTPGEPGYQCEAGYVCRQDACVVAACNDDVDDDGNGDGTNYPDDPGCESISDDDEADSCPGGSDCPRCSNGVDDDGDGATDYPADQACEAASDNNEFNECVPGLPVQALNTSRVEATTPAANEEGSKYMASCADADKDKVTEDVYAFRTTRAYRSLTFSTTMVGGKSNILSVHKGDCASADAEIACVRDPGARTHEVTIPNPELNETYFVFVDGEYVPEVDYILTVSGVLEGGQACSPAEPQVVCNTAEKFSCIEGTCRRAPCADGDDNDGDGLVDLADPGCDSFDDLTESPDPTVSSQCFDGIDNDGDGLTDYPADPGCTRASSDLEESCSTGEAAIPLTASITEGDSAGASHDWLPSCVTASEGPDHVYKLAFPGNMASVTVDTTGSSFDTVVYIRQNECANTEDLICVDEGVEGNQGPTKFTATNIPAGLYYLILDGYYSSGEGPYTLKVEGTMASGQPCDPAQIAAGITACQPGETCQDGICQL